MTKNSCDGFRDDIVAYLDGELTAPERLHLTEHLQMCAQCRRELDELRLLQEAMPVWEQLEPTQHFERTFWSKIESYKQSQKPVRRNAGIFEVIRCLLSERFGVASALAFAACLLVVSLWTFRAPRQSTDADLKIAQDMELFLNMDIIEKSDALEHFEIISMLDVLQQDVKG